MRDFNENNLFKNMSETQSFESIAQGNALSQNLESVTGNKLGSENRLMKVNLGKIPGVNIKDKKNYVAHEDKSLVINRVDMNMPD